MSACRRKDKIVVLSVAFRIFFAICGVVCVKLSRSSVGDWEDIFVTHLIIIIKSEVSISLIVVIFPLLCACGGCRFRIQPGKAGFRFLYYCAVLCLMICANKRIQYGPMVVFVCLHIALPHYLHYADVSESIELLKCLSCIFREDTFTTFATQIWLPDFILGINSVRIFCARPIGQREVICHLGNNTVISFINWQAGKYLNCLTKSGNTRKQN